MTSSSVAAVTTESPQEQLLLIEADIKRNYETINKCAFENGRLYVHGKELCEELGKDFDEWVDGTSFSRGSAYRFMSVFRCFKNPKYIDLVPQIQDSGQMLLARPKLKYATEILDYIVENIATEKDPKKKRLTNERVEAIIHKEQARIHAEREGAKPPPTQEEEELRDLVSGVEAWNKDFIMRLTGAIKVYCDRRWKTPEELAAVGERLRDHDVKPDILGPAGIKALEDLTAYFRRAHELLPSPPPKRPRKKPP